MAQILFKNAKLLDPYADAVQGGMSVVVEGETVREVSAKAIKAPKADAIDCNGRTLMPGLIDCQTVGPTVYTQFAGLSNWPFGAALAFVLMTATLLLTVTSNWLAHARYRR